MFNIEGNYLVYIFIWRSTCQKLRCFQNKNVLFCVIQTYVYKHSWRTLHSFLFLYHISKVFAINTHSRLLRTSGDVYKLLRRKGLFDRERQFFTRDTITERSLYPMKILKIEEIYLRAIKMEWKFCKYIFSWNVLLFDKMFHILIRISNARNISSALHIFLCRLLFSMTRASRHELLGFDGNSSRSNLVSGVASANKCADVQFIGSETESRVR